VSRTDRDRVAQLIAVEIRRGQKDIERIIGFGQQVLVVGDRGRIAGIDAGDGHGDDGGIDQAVVDLEGEGVRPGIGRQRRIGQIRRGAGKDSEDGMVDHREKQIVAVDIRALEVQSLGAAADRRVEIPGVGDGRMVDGIGREQVDGRIAVKVEHDGVGQRLNPEGRAAAHGPEAFADGVLGGQVVSEVVAHAGVGAQGAEGLLTHPVPTDARGGDGAHGAVFQQFGAQVVGGFRAAVEATALEDDRRFAVVQLRTERGGKNTGGAGRAAVRPPDHAAVAVLPGIQDVGGVAGGVFGRGRQAVYLLVDAGAVVAGRNQIVIPDFLAQMIAGR